MNLKKLNFRLGSLYPCIVLLGIGVGFALNYGVRAAIRPNTPVLGGEKLVDFGLVNVGQELAGAFRLENVGPVPLTIDAVKSDCACAVVSPTVEKVSAGGEMEIAFTYRPDRWAGEHEARLTIFSQELPPVTLRVRAYVKAGYPERVDFGRVAPGKGAEIVVPIHSATGEDSRFERITCNTTLFEVRPVEEEGVGSPKHLKIILRETAPVGVISDTLEFTTNERFAVRKNIDLVGEVRSWVRSIPEVVEWEYRTARNGMAPRLNLEGERNHCLVVQSVSFKGQSIEFHARNAVENHMLTLEFPGILEVLSGQLEKGLLHISGTCGERAFDLKVTFFARLAKTVRSEHAELYRTKSRPGLVHATAFCDRCVSRRG